MRPRHTPGRSVLVIFILVIGLVGILWRLVDLSVINRHFLLQQSDARILRTIDIPAHRGMIMDRTHSALALSSPVYSVWINPKNFQATKKQLHQLSHLLEIPISTIQQRNNPHKGFVYLKRKNTPDTMHAIETLNIPGVHFQMEYQRFYPEGEVLAQVLGMTNIDDRGQEGV